MQIISSAFSLLQFFLVGIHYSSSVVHNLFRPRAREISFWNLSRAKQVQQLSVCPIDKCTQTFM